DSRISTDGFALTLTLEMLTQEHFQASLFWFMPWAKKTNKSVDFRLVFAYTRFILTGSVQ
ncbi:MAG: hypothetical protein ACLQNE_08875, partial [Thermoguttaceae bacterium]